MAAEAPAVAAAEGCGGRDGEVGRRGGSAGIGECHGFFYSTRGEERGEVRSVIRTLVAGTRAARAAGGSTAGLLQAVGTTKVSNFSCFVDRSLRLVTSCEFVMN